MKHIMLKFSEIPGISEMDLQISEVCDWSINTIGDTLKKWTKIRQICKRLSNNIDK